MKNTWDWIIIRWAYLTWWSKGMLIILFPLMFIVLHITLKLNGGYHENTKDSADDLLLELGYIMSLWRNR
jgi:hypothetical protein